MGHVARVMLHLVFLCCVASAHAEVPVVAENASGATDKKFNIYDYSTWPRSISALTKFKEVTDGRSGYKMSAGGASYPTLRQDKKCQYYFNALSSLAQKEVTPQYLTDDDRAHFLRKYRIQCPVYSKNGQYARGGDFLTEEFGHFNFKIFRMNVKRGRELLCADADTLLIEGRFVTCAVPDVRSCGFVKYEMGKLRGAPILATANAVVNSDGVPDASYPYGISLVMMGERYFALSAMKQPVQAAQYYAFRLTSVDYFGDAFCFWTFVKKSDGGEDGSN